VLGTDITTARRHQVNQQDCAILGLELPQQDREVRSARS
jgi:hypothetical protein